MLVCLGQYGNYRTDSLTSMEQKFLPLELLYHMTGCFCDRNSSICILTLQKQIQCFIDCNIYGCFDDRVVTLVAVKMKRLAREVYINGAVLQTNCMRQLERQLPSIISQPC